MDPSHPGEPETESEYDGDEENRPERLVPIGFDHAYIMAILGIVSSKHKSLVASNEAKNGPYVPDGSIY